MNTNLLTSAILASSVLVVGCASQPADQEQSPTDPATTKASAAEDLKPFRPSGAVTCRYEKPIGSHMMKKICTSAEDDARNQRETRDLMRSGRLPKSKRIGHTTRER